MKQAKEAADGAISLSWLRELAGKWSAEQREAIADGMFEHVGSDITPIVDDELLASLARGTASAIVDLAVSMIAKGIPSKRAEPPVVATEYARLMADRALPLEDLLRSYRLGHAFLGRALADAVMALDLDPRERLDGVRAVEQFMFVFVDVISSKVGAVYLEHRRRLHRRSTMLRSDLVRAILKGDEVDVSRAERALGHSLTQLQIAFLCWNDGDSSALEHAAAAMHEALNTPRPLLLPLDDGSLCGWFDLSHGFRSSARVLAQVTRNSSPTTHVALGPALPGIEGFRRSRAAVERVKRVVLLSGRLPPTFTTWTNVALVDALSADLHAAQDLVQRELGRLSRNDSQSRTLRETVRCYMASGFSYSAVAAELHIHRNTALQRIKRAETLIGRPVTERPAEMLAALALTETIGPAVLDRV